MASGVAEMVTKSGPGLIAGSADTRDHRSEKPAEAVSASVFLALKGATSCSQEEK